MKEFNYKEWLETLNDDERSMLEYLEYAQLVVEENPNYERPIKEEHMDEDWAVYPFILRDLEAAWDPVYIGTAQNVFEAHECIVNELLDDLCAEMQDYGKIFPERIYSSQENTFLYPTEAPYWAYMWKNSKNFPTIKEFVANYAWELKICALIAEGYKNVDLNKLV